MATLPTLLRVLAALGVALPAFAQTADPPPVRPAAPERPATPPPATAERPATQPPAEREPLREGIGVQLEPGSRPDRPRLSATLLRSELGDDASVALRLRSNGLRLVLRVQF